jgi:transketolase
VRPADARETAAAWRLAMQHRGGPLALALTRQNLPIYAASAPRRDGLERGGYILAEASGGSPSVILMASGSEVEIILAAQRQLEADGITTRVVSMPCLELFAQQDADWRQRVLPRQVGLRVAVEAAHPSPWWRWVGDAGDVIGIERFGASAPYKTVYTEFGLTADAVVDRVRQLRR